jgi:hypothetical protein
MPTKEQLYTFVKSAKKAKCNQKGVCGAISSMSKSELVNIAYAIGFDPSQNRFTYNKQYDKSSSGNSSSSSSSSSSRTRTTRRQQEEKKEETWQEKKARGKEIEKEADKIIQQLTNKAQSMNKDLSSTKEWKNAIKLGDKGFNLIMEADKLRRQKLGLPTRQQEREQKRKEIEKKKKARLEKEAKEKEERKRKRNK